MTNIAIYGYGNLGHAAEKAVLNAPDCALAGIYSRRGAAAGKTQQGAPVRAAGELFTRRGIDVVLNCGGSAKDLPVTTPLLARNFCVVDSFDTHPAIPQHFAAVSRAAAEGGTLCLVCAGWDPGLFSLARMLTGAFMPRAALSTFWGPGVSQGHSDALRRLPGVADARQYTVPVPQAVENARSGLPPVPAQQCHRRVCYIVAEPSADHAEIERRIRSMPDYFSGYQTEIHFISQNMLAEEHCFFPHGGSVIAVQKGSSAAENLYAELKLVLGSNPDFTAGILAACARAVHRLYLRGERGCRTLPEIAPVWFCPQEAEVMRGTLL